MKTKVTYGKPTKKQVEKFERTVKEMVEGRKKRRPRAGVGAEILRVVRAMPHSMHDLACKHSHSPVAEDAIPGKPSVCPCYHCRLEALLATATPEQASQKQPCDCQQLCERLTNPLPLGRFCMADAAQEKMRAEPPQAGWQPQAASGGALDTLDKQARALAEELVVFAHDEDEETGGEWFSVVKAIPLIVKALAAHDQKVRAEVLAPIIAHYANFYDNAIFTRKDILDFLASDTEAKSYFEALLRNARKDALEEAALLVDKAFEQSWVVQDTLDAIRSLASGAVEKENH